MCTDNRSAHGKARSRKSACSSSARLICLLVVSSVLANRCSAQESSIPDGIQVAETEPAWLIHSETAGAEDMLLESSVVEFPLGEEGAAEPATVVDRNSFISFEGDAAADNAPLVLAPLSIFLMLRFEEQAIANGAGRAWAEYLDPTGQVIVKELEPRILGFSLYLRDLGSPDVLLSYRTNSGETGSLRVKATQADFAKKIVLRSVSLKQMP